jgi:hypothetical protein
MRPVIFYTTFLNVIFFVPNLRLFIAGFLTQTSEFVTSLDFLEFMVENVALRPFFILLPLVNLLIFETLYHQ